MYYACTPYKRYDSTCMVVRNEPRNYIAEWYIIWIPQLVERSYVKRDTLGSTPASSLYFSTIFVTRTLSLITQSFSNVACQTLVTMCLSQQNSCSYRYTCTTSAHTIWLLMNNLFQVYIIFKKRKIFLCVSKCN